MKADVDATLQLKFYNFNAFTQAFADHPNMSAVPVASVLDPGSVAHSKVKIFPGPVPDDCR